VEIIGRPKHNSTQELAPRILKKSNISKVFLYHIAALKAAKVYKVSPTNIGQQPIDKFFIDHEGKHFPACYTPELKSTSFVISPQAAKALKIPVGRRKIPARAWDVGERKTNTKGLLMTKLGLLCSNHRTVDNTDHNSKVLKPSSEYNALIPTWYLTKHKAHRISDCCLHSPLCSERSFGHGKMYPEYFITYGKTVALGLDAIHIGAVIFNYTDIL
jgi:hypothetical protein